MSGIGKKGGPRREELERSRMFSRELLQRRQEGKTYGEIAKIYGLKYHTVWYRINLAAEMARDERIAARECGGSL